MRPLGLIAGSGGLPVEVVRACAARGRRVFVIRLARDNAPEIAGADGIDAGIGELGRALEALRRAGCASVCFAGIVPRPDFRSLKPDLRGMAALPRVLPAAAKGDDALLRAVLGEFEREGFTIESPDAVAGDLTIGEGALGAVRPGPEHALDIERALSAARMLGVMDAGQAAVSAGGVILALEAQEGTAAMLLRCAELPASLRGRAGARLGVLAKTPKPIQDRRVDLPTIGLSTVEAAAEAGLAGIAGEAGALIVIDREAVVDAADRLGLFIVGAPPHGA